MFEGRRVWEAVWPEYMGVGSYVVGEVVAAQVDTAMATTFKNYPVAQTTVTGLAILGSALALGSNKAVGFAKGVFYGATVGLFINIVRTLYEMATKKSAHTMLGDVAALVPRRVGQLPAGGGKGGLTIETRNLQLGGGIPVGSEAAEKVAERRGF
jgi:hypothetical protein